MSFPDTADRPSPTPTPETQRYWDAANERRLELPRCPTCDTFVFPPRPYCPRCTAATRWETLSGGGRLASYVIIERPPAGWQAGGPLVVALVELDEGPRLMSNLVGVDADPAQLPLDMALTVEFEPRRDQLVPVFRPTVAG